MNKQLINEAMARLDKDGHEGFWCVKCGDIDGVNTTYEENCAICGLPAMSGEDYTTSHDACQRVYKDLPIEAKLRVTQLIADIVRPQVEDTRYGIEYALTLTASDLCVFILRALGLRTGESVGCICKTPCLGWFEHARCKICGKTVDKPAESGKEGGQ